MVMIVLVVFCRSIVLQYTDRRGKAWQLGQFMVLDALDAYFRDGCVCCMPAGLCAGLLLTDPDCTASASSS